MWRIGFRRRMGLSCLNLQTPPNVRRKDITRNARGGKLSNRTGFAAFAHNAEGLAPTASAMDTLQARFARGARPHAGDGRLLERRRPDPTLPTRRGDHLPLVLCFYVAIPLQYWLIGRLVRPVRDLHPGIRLPAVAGRHKLAPRVSPSKTVEGLLGGGLSVTAIGACLWWITPFTFWGSAGMSLVIVLAGFLGGLALSAVKRSIGAKDWGSMIGATAASSTGSTR